MTTDLYTSKLVALSAITETLDELSQALAEADAGFELGPVPVFGAKEEVGTVLFDGDGHAFFEPAFN